MIAGWRANPTSKDVVRLTPPTNTELKISFTQLLKPRDETFMPIAEDVHLGNNVNIRHPYLVNLYGCASG
jgi:hypothetical protein